MNIFFPVILLLLFLAGIGLFYVTAITLMHLLYGRTCHRFAAHAIRAHGDDGKTLQIRAENMANLERRKARKVEEVERALAEVRLLSIEIQKCRNCDICEHEKKD